MTSKKKRRVTVRKPFKYPVTPHQESWEHHSFCEICGTLVDELDLEEVLKHVEPEHEAPPKN
jgi:hypothetical protein